MLPLDEHNGFQSNPKTPNARSSAARGGERHKNTVNPVFSLGKRLKIFCQALCKLAASKPEAEGQEQAYILAAISKYMLINV
jgi:hypothetical protein